MMKEVPVVKISNVFAGEGGGDTLFELASWRSLISMIALFLTKTDC